MNEGTNFKGDMPLEESSDCQASHTCNMLEHFGDTPGATVLVSIHQSGARRLESNCEMMGIERICEKDKNMSSVFKGIL
jgi:hypothetical protein